MIQKLKYNFISPAGATFIFLLLVNLVLLASINWNPLALIRIGTRFSEGDPNGTEGYDGQFIYYIARDPNPATVIIHLDVPAYRYQRILLPIFARMVSFGHADIIPWALIGLGIISQTVGTWLVSKILISWGINRWYAITYGLWVGFTLAIQLGLPDSMAYGLAAGGIIATERGRSRLGWILYGLAIFTKETTILFLAAQLLSDLLRWRWKSAIGFGLVAVLPWLLFQGWLWFSFGQPGIGSGGAMATPFEVIPYMGLWRIGTYSLPLLLTWVIIFGPIVVLPSAWGLWASIRQLIARDTDVTTMALLLNSLMIISTPFSTFREPLGILRYACGLVLAALLFTAKNHRIRVLNILSILWLAMNAFLVKLFLPASIGS